MTQARPLTTFLALGALAALPGCSTLGLDGSGGSTLAANVPPPAYTSPPPSYAPAPQASAGEYEAPNAPPATASAQPETNAWANVPAPVSARTIRRVQTALKQDDFYRGSIDGVWGPQSADAMRRFQQANNLPLDGQIDLASLNAMNLVGPNRQVGQTGEPGFTTGPQNTHGTAQAGTETQPQPAPPAGGAAAPAPAPSNGG
jgi:hypothetical protein